jgi:hypothetical protein
MWQKDNWQKALSHEGCGEEIVAGLGKGWGQGREALSRGVEKDSIFRTCSDPVRLFWFQISEERLFKFRYSSEIRNHGVQKSGVTRAFH